MNFIQNGTTFQCHCDNGEFNRHAVVAAIEWCSNNATSWNKVIHSMDEHDLRDFGEGLAPIGEKQWSVRFWFGNDAEAIAFKLALDGLLAEAAC